MPKKFKGDKSGIAMGAMSEAMPCKVLDGDEVLTEQADIDYYKASIKEFEARNRLLGEVNEEGEYVISEDVRRNLALIPKEQLTEGYNLIEAYSRVATKDLFFVIEFEEEIEAGRDDFVASLYIIEKVVGYKNLQSLRSFVAKIVEPKSDEFWNKVRKVFNINPILMPIDEGKYMPLVMQIQKHIEDWYSMEEIVDLSSQIYVMRVLQLLENEGPLGRQIVEEYNREMKLEDLGNVNVAKRYIMLRKILDRVIEQHGGEANVFKEEKNKAEIKVIKSEYSAPIRKVETFRTKVQESQRGVLRKKDRQKKEEKASSPAKKAGGAKKKAAGKKADKKAGGSKPKKDKKKEDKKEKKDDKKKYGVGKGLKEIEAVADLILQTAKNVGEVLGRAKTPKIEVVGVEQPKNPVKKRDPFAELDDTELPTDGKQAGNAENNIIKTPFQDNMPTEISAQTEIVITEMTITKQDVPVKENFEPQQGL